MQKVEFLEVPTSALRKNLWNSNQVDPLNEEKIKTSIERNGMFKPIIVRQVAGVDGYEIVGGEHRWEQAIRLGYDTVPIANLGEISDAKAKEIGIIDNARYGADDAILLADILKDIGTLEEIQDFLPYGDADLNAIFSSSIAIPDLDALGNDDEEVLTEQEKLEKPTKTHQVMRFKVGIKDAERLTALIAKTQREQGYTTADELTNAGDALVHLLGAAPAGFTLEPVEDDLEAQLDALQAEQESRE